MQFPNLNNLRHKALAPAFSILELLATMVIMAMLTVAVLEVLHRIESKSQLLHQQMLYHGSINHSLNQLVDDVIAASTNNIQLTVDSSSYGWHDTARLTIRSGTTSGKSKSTDRIDWVSVPRYLDNQQTDLVLYRRHQGISGGKDAIYIPICDNLYSFQVELLDQKGLPTDSVAPKLIVATARIYRSEDRDPDRVLTVSRTLSLKRF